MLKFQGCNNSHKAFDEVTPTFALSAKRRLAPKYSRTDLLLSEIVGWNNTIMVDKSPKSLFTFENISASASRFLMAALSTKPEKLTDFGAKRLAQALKFGARNLALQERMPKGKNLYFLVKA